jgi:hypothetical protein
LQAKAASVWAKHTVQVQYHPDLVKSGRHQNTFQFILVDVHHDPGAVDCPFEGVHAFLQRVQAMEVVCCSDNHMLCCDLLPFDEKISLDSSSMK